VLQEAAASLVKLPYPEGMAPHAAALLDRVERFWAIFGLDPRDPFTALTSRFGYALVPLLAEACRIAKHDGNVSEDDIVVAFLQTQAGLHTRAPGEPPEGLPGADS